jgi:hypothetical protein
LKGKRVTASFYKFQKPMPEHRRRKKEMLYPAKDKKLIKALTLQDILAQETDDKQLDNSGEMA